MAERKGTGTVIRATQQPYRHGPERQPLCLAQVRVSKRDAKEGGRSTIAVGRLDIMNL